MVGYLSHLLLDEIYSVEWHRGRLRLKKSFGTALKLWSRNRLSNLSVYAKLLILSAAIFFEPQWPETPIQPDRLPSIQPSAMQVIDRVFYR